MATWLITGCSTGLGRALAEEVLAHGDNVVVTARDVSKVKDFAERYPDSALPLALDVTVAAQVKAAVDGGTDRFGAIDVLVNNAGYGYRAAVEEADESDVNTLFATHFFGTVSGIKAVLPQMRARRAGTIVNLSSIGVHLAGAGSGYYAAAKAAIEGMSSALRKEVEPLGITVMTIEPGQFRTDFAGRSLTQSATVIHDYADTAGKRRKENVTNDGAQPGDPVKAARAIITVLDSGNAPELLILGEDAVAIYRASLEESLASLEKWRTVGESTNYDE